MTFALNLITSEGYWDGVL